MSIKRVIKFFYNNFYVPLFGLLVYPIVAWRFRKDSRVIPLTNKHRRLYFIIHSLVIRRLKRFPVLLNPIGFNDKIQWLKLFDQREVQVTCSDKVLAKEYIKDKVGEEYVIKTCQVVDKYNDIDFDSLPSKFVMKTNHDSGTVVIVNDKKNFNSSKAKLKLGIALKTNFGHIVGEWAYTLVNRKILIEEFVESDSGIRDFKFYVVNGVVKFCHFIYDRDTSPKGQIIMKDGTVTDLILHKKFDGEFKKFDVPEAWDKMIKMAEKLGENFKCVRVDLYYERGRILVGELTFWPQAGCYKGKDEGVIGQMLDFDLDTVCEPVWN